MIVCLCHRVSDRDIERQARCGCASFNALQQETRVATACGACREQAQDLFAAATLNHLAAPGDQPRLSGSRHA